MGTTLYAGAARRAINPLLGTGKAGLRLFGSPIQAIESDLTATVLVLGDGDTKVVLIATDLCVISMAEGGRLRSAVAEALGTPVSHVLLNLSHNHSAPALPEFMSMTDSEEDVPFRVRYERDLLRWLVEAALEADSRLQPARIGCGWGESTIGVYRRETRDGRDVLGEVPDHPIDTIRRRDPRRRPRRHPDRRPLPLLRPPGHGREPVAGRLGGLPGTGAGGARAQPRRPRPLPPGLRRQRQPPRRDRLRSRLPRHQEPRRPRARRRSPQDRRPDPHQHQGRRAPPARQRPQHPLHPLGSPSTAPPAPTSPPPRPPSRSTTTSCPRSSRLARSWPTGRRRARSGSPATPSTGRSGPPRSTSTGPRSSSPRSRTGIRPTTSTSRRSASTTSSWAR